LYVIIQFLLTYRVICFVLLPVSVVLKFLKLVRSTTVKNVLLCNKLEGYLM